MSAHDLLQLVSEHETLTEDSAPDTSTIPDDDPDDSQQEQTELLAFLANRASNPGDLRQVLSKMNKARSGSNSATKAKGPRQVSMHETIRYNVSNHEASKQGSLVDQGANGGLAGDDVWIVLTSKRAVYVSGIDGHCVNNLPILTAGGVVTSQRGPVIVILHQYAYMGKGKSIHSSGQLEHHRNDVNDKSMKVNGGMQRIVTNDGYVFPLNIKNGLPYLKIRPYTDDEWETLPHVVWTADEEWDPTVLNHEIINDTEWYDAVSDMQEGIINSPFDEFGNYRHREVDMHFFDTEQPEDIEDIIDATVMAHNPMIEYYEHESNEQEEQVVTIESPVTTAKEPNYEALRPYFLHTTPDVIKCTFKATTQYGRMPVGTKLWDTYNIPFPACNVK